MNMNFKVIWDCTRNIYIAVSELAKGHCRTSCKSTLSKLCILSILFPISSMAQDYNISSYDPGNNSNGQGQIIVNDGDITNIIDVLLGYENISQGVSGYMNITLQQALDLGYITAGKNDVNSVKTSLGGKTKYIQYVEAGTGVIRTTTVYDSSNIYEADVSTLNTVVNTAAGAGQYADMKIATVNAGGVLNVDVGSTGVDWASDSQNIFKAVTKNTNVYNVETSSSDTKNATLNYNSKTIVQSGNVSNVAKSGGRDYTFNELTYVGSVNSIIGSFNVNNIDDFKTYNDSLILALGNGVITPEQYDQELLLAYTSQTKNIHIDANITAGDPSFLLANRDVNSFIKASGYQSIVNITADANIQAVSSDTSVVRLNDRATLNNYGVLGVSSGAAGGDYVVAATDSLINNYGVIDAGSSRDLVTGWVGAHTGIMAKGDSSVTNKGVINMASHQSSYNAYAVVLQDNTTFSNADLGVMNIVTGGEPVTSNVGLFTYGLFMQDSVHATNDGKIYIGRTTQNNASEVTDTVSVNLPSIGVYNKGGDFLNNGTITITDLVANAIAIQADNKFSPAIFSTTQAGTVDVDGKTSGINVAIEGINNAKNIINSGVINLRGFNGIGVRLLSGSEAVNTGIINIYGSDPNNAYNKNFGAWVEGANSTLTMNGNVHLYANDAIGLHARDGAEIDISDVGQVVFHSGSNQTGYYIYGNGSTINNSSALSQNVSTQGSTLYRIDGGATFDGSNQHNSQMSSSAIDSTIIQVTGSGSLLTSGKITLDITGDNNTGIKVEGGANAEITTDTIINAVAGNNTTVGIVDGNYYDLHENIDATRNGNSVLTSYAVLNSSNTASHVLGYIARNSGTLNHRGTINFDQSGSTGIQVSNGVLNNDGSISVNGTAINIQGADSVVNNQATVSAIDGVAAYLVGNDATLNLNGSGLNYAGGSAHAVLLDTGAKGLTVDGATITMSDTGSGNAIENKANIEGIHLKDATINIVDGIGVHTGASMAQTNSGTINVTGNGTGILFENIDGSQTDQRLDMSDSKDLVINVQQAGGQGIVTNTSTDLQTGASVNVLNGSSGAALIVKGTTHYVEQSGELISASMTSPVVDINNASVNNFINRGKIQALDANHVALFTNTGSGVAFSNASGAFIQGQVNLLSGNNQVTLESGSTGTDFNTGSGNDLFVLDGTKLSDTGLFTSLNAGNGDDTLRMDNSDTVITRATAISGMEHVDLISDSNLTLDNVTMMLGDGNNDAIGTGYIIDSASTLTLKSGGDLIFNSHLAGKGTLAVDTNNSNFDFTSNNALDGFGGMVALQNSRFELTGLNAQALSNAELILGSGNITHVGSGQHNIGGLTFNGGTASFDGVFPGKNAADGTIHSATMDLLGRGTIQSDSGTFNNDRPLIDTLRPILQQDDGQPFITLASSDSAVLGSAGNLVLTDNNGHAISDAVNADISQNGSVIAKASYDYRLTSGDNNNGLYINYGLTQIELLGQGSDALILDASGKINNAADLSARVTGNGDLAVDSLSGQTVSLSNMDNDYTGITDVRSGNLLMLNDNVLGKTTELKLAAGSIFDMNGHSQEIGNVNDSADSVLNIDGGSLTLSHGGTSAGTLTGEGELNIAGDTLTVLGANASLSAMTTIASGAQAILDSTLGLGIGDIISAGKLALNSAEGVLYNNLSNSGQITLNASNVMLAGDNTDFNGRLDIDGTSQLTASRANQIGDSAIHNQGKFVINSSTNWILNNLLDGSGSLIKQGAGSITLTPSSSYTGITDIQQGEIILGNADAPLILASQQVNIATNGTLSGFGGTDGNIGNAGVLQLGSDSPRPALMSFVNSDHPTQIFTVGGNLINRGLVNLGIEGQPAGNQLLVNGSYHGDGGLLHFNTELNDDNSITDKLVVKGDTSGNTNVTVSKAGGGGAQTINGIEIIQVDGHSEGEFTQSGRITAGAFDYSLVRGQGDNQNNWYLTNSETAPGSGSDPTSDPTVDPTSTPNSVLRPEAGSYIANLSVANNMFNTRLHDRMGETQYIDALTGEKKVTSMWLRQVGNHNNWRDGSGQLKTQSNTYVAQVGGDIAHWSTDGLNRGHLGLMAGYGNNHSHTHSQVNGYGSDGSVTGYSVGVYGTWFANDADKSGLYIDSWMQYSWFNNHVNGEQLASESYKSKGLTASLETGYTLKMGEFVGSKGSINEWFIQPQAQVIWMGIEADDHTEANGTRVQGNGDGNVQTRLGLRTYLKGHHKIDDGKGRTFEPFVETNWIHNTEKFSAVMDGVSVSQAGARNVGEVKVGVEGQLNPHLNLWGNVGVQVGSDGYNDSAAMIGVKVAF